MTDNFNPINSAEVQCPPCPHCGKAAVVLAPLSGVFAYRRGALLQDAFPDMAPEVREMLLTGIHPACWGPYLGPDEEPDDDGYVNEDARMDAYESQFGGE